MSEDTFIRQKFKKSKTKVQEVLDDDSIMNFGSKHRGKRLEDVPADYLLYIYENCESVPQNLKDYIFENMDLLKIEVKNNLEEKLELPKISNYLLD